MIEAEDTYPVPWDSLWDDAIEQQIEAGRLGRVGDLRGDGVLHWPRRLLVDVRVSRNKDIQAALRTARARSSRVADRQIAARLGLRLYAA
ncbi:MAG: hypothetical protein ACRDLN_17055, partial [Solirubrobacteraceae bacterium]